MSSGFIYVIQMEGTSFYKIGRTTDLSRRMATLGTLLPTQRLLRVAVRVEDHERLETTLHEEFAALRMNGEWFDLKEIHLERIRLFLLYCQGEDLLGRAVRAFTSDDLYPDRVTRWGRFFCHVGRRQERRLTNCAKLLPPGPFKFANEATFEGTECHA